MLVRRSHQGTRLSGLNQHFLIMIDIDHVIFVPTSNLFALDVRMSFHIGIP